MFAPARVAVGGAVMVSTPHHVVHVLGSLTIGGAERQLVNYLEVADRKDFRHSVVCLTARGEFAASVEQLGVSVHLMRVRQRTLPRDLTVFARWLRRERVAIVHSHLYYASLWGRLAAILARVPVLVTTEHGRELWKNRLQIAAGRWLSRRTCRHLAVSADGMRLRIEREGLDPGRFLRIANGVRVPPEPIDPETRGRVRAALGIETDALVVGSVGRVVPAKDLTTLVDALADLAGRHSRLRWLQIGEGPELAAVRQRAVDRKVAGAVVWAGSRRDVPDLLAALDVFVMPSVREGMPVALLEALAAGVPAVVTDVGGMPEAIAHGESGLVVPARDPVALAAALQSLLVDPDRRQKLSVQARATARAHFSSDAVARRIETVYRECLAARETAGGGRRAR